jgi:hypothetical protein
MPGPGQCHTIVLDMIEYSMMQLFGRTYFSSSLRSISFSLGGLYPEAGDSQNNKMDWQILCALVMLDGLEKRLPMAENDSFSVRMASAITFTTRCKSFRE